MSVGDEDNKELPSFYHNRPNAHSDGTMRFPTSCVTLILLLAGLSGCVTIDHVETIGSGVERETASGGPSDIGARRASLDTDRFIAADGIALPLRSWLPEGPPGAVIL